MRKLTYYVGTTIDGFIADPSGGFDFFPHAQDVTAEYPDAIPTHVRTQLGMAEVPPRNWDTVVMGRATYAPALRIGVTNPYAHLRTYVFSRTLHESPDPAVHLLSGDPAAKVGELKQQQGLGIWLCGGADLAGQLIEQIDELIVKIHPLVIGSGIRLFNAGFSPRRFRLARTRPFPSGTVIATYVPG